MTVSGPWGDAPPRIHAVKFDDNPDDLEKVVLNHGAISVLTVGFYRFWMKTWLRKLIWSKISVDGDALEYTGTAVELLLGTLIAVIILGGYLMCFNLAISVGGLAFWQSGVFNVSLVLSFVASLPLLQFAIYRARRYRLLRTRWRGIRFGMDGSAFRFVGIWVGWATITLITLGLAYPWLRMARERYMTEHMMFGDTRFGFEANAKTLMSDYLPFWFAGVAPLFVITLGMASQVIFGSFSMGAWGLLIPVYLYVVVWLYCRYRAAEYRAIFEARTLREVRTRCAFEADGLINPAWAYVGRSIIPSTIPVGLVISVLTAAAIYLAALNGGGDASFTWSLENVIFANYEGIVAKTFLIAAFWINYGLTILLLLWLWTVVYYRRFLKYLCASMRVSGLESLSDVRQRTTDDQIDSEGFADALDVGGL